MPKKTVNMKAVGAASVNAEILIDGVEILTKFPGMFVDVESIKNEDGLDPEKVRLT